MNFSVGNIPGGRTRTASRARRLAAAPSTGTREEAGGAPIVGLRILLNSEIAMGPGKADLLESIAATGSISAAARQMGMSYRRAWLLVETMNHCFAEPLVLKEKGGADGGGAMLSPTGKRVLRKYRRLSWMVTRAFEDLLNVNGSQR